MAQNPITKVKFEYIGEKKKDAELSEK